MSDRLKSAALLGLGIALEAVQIAMIFRIL
jgi:hypothetical protein